MEWKNIIIVSLMWWQMVMSEKILSRKKRVINGYNNFDIHDYPWAGVLFGRTKNKWYQRHLPHYENYCGASIVNNQWLLTAAHCFTSKKADFRNPSNWQARLGTKKLKPSFFESVRNVGKRLINERIEWIITQQEYYHIDKIITHPNYDSSVLDNDIALVKIKEKIEMTDFENMNPIDINESKDLPKPGDICIMLGFGCTTAGNRTVSQTMNAIDLRILKSVTCDKGYKYNAYLNYKTEMCAGGFNQNFGICPGDSGSGLACKYNNAWKLVGVASATHYTQPQNYPGIFTRIAPFKDWIRNITNLN